MLKTKLTINGPALWHSGHEPGLTSEFCDCTNGPRIYPHLLQSYLTTDNCGNTPVVAVITPTVLTSWFKWSLRNVLSSSMRGRSDMRTWISDVTRS